MRMLKILSCLLILLPMIALGQSEDSSRALKLAEDVNKAVSGITGDDTMESETAKVEAMLKKMKEDCPPSARQDTKKITDSIKPFISLQFMVTGQNGHSLSDRVLTQPVNS